MTMSVTEDRKKRQRFVTIELQGMKCGHKPAKPEKDVTFRLVHDHMRRQATRLRAELSRGHWISSAQQRDVMSSFRQCYLAYHIHLPRKRKGFI